MMGWTERLIDRIPKWWAFWLVIAGLILSGLGMGLGWDWLRSGAAEKEPNSTTIRNSGIVIAGIFALVFALWRGLVAERQAAASQRQAETSERQAETALRQTETAQRHVETAQQGLLNERYQRGAEMLGNDVLAVRMGGICALQRLAEEHPEQYHVQIMQLFCAYVRNPTGQASIQVLRYEDGKPVYGPREDVQAVMYAIGSRTNADIALERAAENFQLDLRNVTLYHSHLSNLNLSYANLESANLSGARLNGAKLSSTRLTRAKLSNASLDDADFSYAFLSDADFSNVSLSGAEFFSASLSRVNLSNAILNGANFFFASLDGANLSDAHLPSADLSNAHLRDADLTRTSFYEVWLPDDDPSPANGLMQGQLDQARSVANSPPLLEGVLDAETGEQLVWRGKPFVAYP